MSDTNKDKSTHGSSNKRGLLDIIIQLKDLDYIISYDEKPKYKIPGYEKPEFYPDFMLSFSDRDKWIVFTTTSLRERFDRTQWQANMLRNLDADIKLAIVVYPESANEKEIKNFVSRQKNIKNGIYYSVIDHVVSQNEFWKMVEEKALSDFDEGKKKHLIGNGFEAKIAHILSNKENLAKMKNKSDVLAGSFFVTYKTIIDCLQIPIGKTKKIEATCDKKIIGKLPRNKNPKTDVLVKATFDDGTHSYYTISCKRTTSKAVSVHEYSADDFINVLGANVELSDLLVKFQNAGSLEAFGTENSSKLTSALKSKQDKLYKWVLGGFGSPVVSPDDEKKLFANFILTEHVVDNRVSIHIYSLNDYKKRLNEHKIIGMFGTPFSWTYPHKKRGKKIQLKLKIVD